MKHHIYAHIAGLFALSAAGQATQAVGALSGTVTDTGGHPLAGAAVSYQRIFRSVRSGPHGNQPIPAPGEELSSGSVTTDSGGAFSLAGLPLGDFLLCATVPNEPFLDPCSWQSAVQVTIASSAATHQQIVLSRGVFLNLHIDDPDGLLPKTMDSAFGGGISAGVIFGTGAYLGARNISVDASGRDYQIAVPAGAPLTLWLHSVRFTFVDSGGHTVPVSGARVPFQAAAGLNKGFTFTVSGRAVAP